MSLWLVIVPFLFSILFFVYKGSGAKLLALIASLILMGITGYAASTMAGDGMMQHMVDYPWITDPMISFKLGIDGMSIILLKRVNHILLNVDPQMGMKLENIQSK